MPSPHHARTHARTHSTPLPRRRSITPVAIYVSATARAGAIQSAITPSQRQGAILNRARSPILGKHPLQTRQQGRGRFYRARGRILVFRCPVSGVNNAGRRDACLAHAACCRSHLRVRNGLGGGHAVGNHTGHRDACLAAAACRRRRRRLSEALFRVDPLPRSRVDIPTIQVSRSAIPMSKVAIPTPSRHHRDARQARRGVCRSRRDVRGPRCRNHALVVGND